MHKAEKLRVVYPKVSQRLKREGTYVQLRLTHIMLWQKPTQHCKAIFLQLKNKLKKKKKVIQGIQKTFQRRETSGMGEGAYTKIMA